MHWAKRKLIKRKLREALEGALSFNGYLFVPYTTPVVLEYTRYRRAGPPMDVDNAVASTKIVTDILVKLGKISNDTPTYVTEVIVHQERDYHQPTRLGIRIRSTVPSA